MKRLALFGLGGLALLVLIAACPTAPRQTLTDAQRTEIVAAVDSALATGALVKVDCKAGNVAHVRRTSWQALDSAGKERIARLLAAYCEATGDAARITLVDAQSAQELGGYSAGRFYVK